jgi:hypothetical protein
MITPDLKDRLLSFIANEAVDSELSMWYTDNERQTIFGHLGFPINFLTPLLKQFEELGLLKMTGAKGYEGFTLKIDAYDFLRYGGFTAKEEIINSNLRKLELEITSLEVNIPKAKFDMVSTTLTTLIAAWSSVYGK